MKIRFLVIVVLVLILVACTPIAPAASPEQADSPSQETEKTTGDAISPEQDVAAEGKGVENLIHSPPQLEASMQTCVLVVKWNNQTHKNEIIPVDTTSAKTPPGAEPVVVGKEFIHAFSPDGKTLAIVASRAGNFWDSVLHWVDVPTWTHQGTSLTFTKWVDQLVFSPDGKYLLIVQWPPTTANQPAAYATLTLMDVPSLTVLAESEIPYRPRVISFSQKGLAVYAAPIASEGVDGFVEALAFLFDLKDLSVRWQAALTGVQEGGSTKLEGTDYIHTFLSPAVVASLDGRFIYVVHANENKLTTVDFESEQVHTVEIAPKLSWLDRLIGLAAGEAHAKVSDGTFKEAAISPDGSRLYVVGTVDDSFKDDKGNWQYSSTPFGLQVVDALTGTEIAHIEIDATRIIGLSPDGSRLYIYADRTDLFLNPRQGYDQTAVFDTTTLEQLKAMSEWNLLPAQTLDGSLFALSSRTTSNGTTTMTVLNPQTLQWTVEWVELYRAYFLTMP